jgi:hypothetical protein
LSRPKCDVMSRRVKSVVSKTMITRRMMLVFSFKDDFAA